MTLRSILSAVLLVALGVGAGFWLRGVGPGAPSRDDATRSKRERAAAEPTTDSPCPSGAQPLYWKAPMDPNYVRPGPGKSPMGMDLVPECPPAGADGEPGIVRIDPTTLHNIGVRTARAERRNLGRLVRAAGRIAYDERRVAHVHTKVQGWVERLHVDFAGQPVRSGQPLLEIYSPELVATQEELLVAARYRESTSRSSFEDVRGGGESLYRATRRRLELWDVPQRTVERLLETGEIQKTLTLYAPSGGVVTDLQVRAGMEVKPNENLYTIADLSSVWVLADVYEYELPWLELGLTGTVELPPLPGEQWSGPVRYIAPFLDETTRTAEIRLELPNPDGRLRPGMFGNVLIQGSGRADVVAIPEETVIRSGRRNLVVVALGEGRFAPREVRLGLQNGAGLVEVREGVEAGEQVVTSGQFLIDSESKLQEAIQKLVAGPDEPGA